MESAETTTKDLFSKVNLNLKKAGHKAAINPNDDSDLDAIKRDAHYLIGSTVEEGLGGASPSVNDRTTKGRFATLIGKFRRKKKLP